MESMLALIEFTQYKSHCKEQLGLEEITTPTHDTLHPEHISDIDIIAQNMEQTMTSDDGAETSDAEKVRRIRFPENGIVTLVTKMPLIRIFSLTEWS